mgnify:CR=1 FL=1
MSDNRDPALQTLFADAEQDLPAQGFTADVMAGVNQHRHRAAAGWVVVGIAVALCVWLLATPLQDAARLLARGFTAPLISLGDGALSQALSPINNVTLPVAAGLFVLFVVYRRLFA